MLAATGPRAALFPGAANCPEGAGAAPLRALSPPDDGALDCARLAESMIAARWQAGLRAERRATRDLRLLVLTSRPEAPEDLAGALRRLRG